MSATQIEIPQNVDCPKCGPNQQCESGTPKSTAGGNKTQDLKCKKCGEVVDAIYFGAADSQ